MPWVLKQIFGKNITLRRPSPGDVGFEIWLSNTKEKFENSRDEAVVFASN